VSDQTGFIPLVIWSHYILDLNVVISYSLGGQIVFGNAREAQVYINWSQEVDEGSFRSNWHDSSQSGGPTIRLHEKDMSVVFECVPQLDDRLSPRSKNGTHLEATV
jgi:hypothetical protein